MSTTQECRHEACDCPAQPDSEFCSSACEKAHEAGEPECPCGHSGCHGTEH